MCTRPHEIVTASIPFATQTGSCCTSLSHSVRHKLPRFPGRGSTLAQTHCQNSEHIFRATLERASCTSPFSLEKFHGPHCVPQEDARHAAEVAANTLTHVHRDALTKCWNEHLLRGTHHEQIRLVSFLLRLHPYFPDWPILSWESIRESMLEDDYVSPRGNDSEDILAHMVSFLPSVCGSLLSPVHSATLGYARPR